MKESRKEFIKKAHSSACSEWKTNIEAEFPKLFKKDDLVVGKWYKEETTNFLVFIKDLKHSSYAGYGFNTRGDWKDSLGRIGLQHIPATDEEVKKALIKEAKKRGFKEGVRIKSIWMSGTAKLFYGELCFDGEFELCYKNNGGMLYTLFNNGVWATIVEETITKEEAKVITDKIEALKNELLNKKILD